MEFTDEDWTAIERACRLQARCERESGIAGHERTVSPDQLTRIADDILYERRARALAEGRCVNCED